MITSLTLNNKECLLYSSVRVHRIRYKCLNSMILGRRVVTEFHHYIVNEVKNSEEEKNILISFMEFCITGYKL